MSLKYEPSLKPQMFRDAVSGVFKASGREFSVDNLLVRIHFIIDMIWRTGLAPWEFESPFPVSLTSTFLVIFLLLLSRRRCSGMQCRGCSRPRTFRGSADSIKSTSAKCRSGKAETTTQVT